ncbi:hypothetical protein M3Y99_01350000 [Aphelenchoides fujianensis]|nr:hypothetical protein M3Y99_01350000 [Aphelenchoides fujianensis]
MEAPLVEPRPRLRAAAARDGLNRFLQIHAMRTDEKKAPLQLVRLAAVSRAQLASLRRHVAELTLTLWANGWHWFLPDVGLDSLAGRTAIRPKVMSGIGKLLRLPVQLNLVDTAGLKNVDWVEMGQIEEFVSDLDLRENPHQFPALSEFVNRVTPQLKNLQCSTDVLNLFSSLDLDKLRLFGSDGLLDALSRHTIRRLDVYTTLVLRESAKEQLFSASIKALGFVEGIDLLEVPSESIVAFCRRFPALEDLHFSVHHYEERRDKEAYYKWMWESILRLRDRLIVPGLKRLFFKIQHLDCSGLKKPGWVGRLKQVEPFDKATFSIYPFDERAYVFLKLSWPTEQLPTFFRIEGDYYWNDEFENKEYSLDLLDDEMDDEDEILNGEDDDFDEDAMDENEAADEDGVDDAGVH